MKSSTYTSCTAHNVDALGLPVKYTVLLFTVLTTTIHAFPALQTHINILSNVLVRQYGRLRLKTRVVVMHPKNSSGLICLSKPITVRDTATVCCVTGLYCVVSLGYYVVSLGYCMVSLGYCGYCAV